MSYSSPSSSSINLADDVEHRAPGVAAVTDADLAEAWFDASRGTAASLTVKPPTRPASTVGEFLGDELADAWLR